MRLKKPFPVLWLYAVCGALLALPMVLPRLAPLAWLAAAPVYYLELNRPAGKHPLRRAYGRGLLFFYAFGLVTFYWFVELYPLDFIGLSSGGAITVICAGWFGLPLLQSSVAALQFVLLHLFLHRCRLSEYRFLYPAAAASLWCLFEFLQTLTWAGVPWGKLAVGQAGLLPLVQSASLLGPYWIAFLVILCNAALATGALYASDGRGKALAAYAAAAAVLFGGNLTFGLCRLALHRTDSTARTVTAAAIQGNISSKDKWDASLLQETLDRYTALTREAAAEGATVIVWPETALPYELAEYPELRHCLSALCLETGATLFVGAFARDAEGRLLNALYLCDADGQFSPAYYVKQHLVPFGEYVPWRSFFSLLFPPLAELSAMAEDIQPGKGPALFRTPDGTVGALICFDSIYESLSRDSVRAGAELLVLATNDSWFGDSAAVWQHNRAAVLRAVENGRCLVRAANTGVSSVIGDTGEVLTELDPLLTGYVTAEVTVSDRQTLYTVIGDAILPVMAAYLAAAAIFCALSARKEKEYAADH